MRGADDLKKLRRHTGEEFIEHLSLRRQLRPLPVAVEQFEIQLFLQRSDLTADGGLTDKQFLRGLGKAQAFSGFEEALHLLTGHS